MWKKRRIPVSRRSPVAVGREGDCKQTLSYEIWNLSTKSDYEIPKHIKVLLPVLVFNLIAALLLFRESATDKGTLAGHHISKVMKKGSPKGWTSGVRRKVPRRSRKSIKS